MGNVHKLQLQINYFCNIYLGRKGQTLGTPLTAEIIRFSKFKNSQATVSRSLLYYTIARTMDLKQFKKRVESCYKPLLGEEFSAKCTDKDSTAVATGGPRDILAIGADDQATARMVQDINMEVSKLEKKYNQKIGCSEATGRVWGGITYNGYHDNWRLWVKGNCSLDCDSTHHVRVTGVEILTDIKWVKKNYVALANITVEVIGVDDD